MPKPHSHAFHHFADYCKGAWALFRAMMRRAPKVLVWGHQFEELAGAHERSPPLK